MKPQGHIPPSASPSAHEAADLHLPSILWTSIVLAIVLAVSVLVLVLFFEHMEREFPQRTSEADPKVPASSLPPVPRLQTSPLRDLHEVRAAEDSHLNQYGWIDHSHGVAQIPIERAMLLWVKSYSSTPVPTSALSTQIPVQAAAPTTNAASATGPTELQMRQQKAQEVSHAP